MQRTTIYHSGIITLLHTFTKLIPYEVTFYQTERSNSCKCYEVSFS